SSDLSSSSKGCRASLPRPTAERGSMPRAAPRWPPPARVTCSPASVPACSHRAFRQITRRQPHCTSEAPPQIASSPRAQAAACRQPILSKRSPTCSRKGSSSSEKDSRHSLDGAHPGAVLRSEEHTSELQSRENLVCRL